MNEVEAKPVTNTSNAASEEPKTPPKEKKVIGKSGFFVATLP